MAPDRRLRGPSRITIVRAEMPSVAARLRLIGWYSAPVLLAVVGSLLDWPGWVVGFLIVGVLTVIGVVRPTPKKSAEKPPLRRFFGFTLWVAGLVCVVATFHAARLTVLDLVGRPAVVTIDHMEMDRTIRRSGRVKIDHCYHLKRSDGGWVTGSLCRETLEYNRGQTVAVLADPTGLVAPETAEEVAGVTWPRNIALGAFAVMVVSALLGGGPAAPERPLVPAGRYPRWRPSPPRPQNRPRLRRRPRKGRRR
jgi:hypothetical protein